MKELFRTNDVVKLSWVKALLSDSGIEAVVLDGEAVDAVAASVDGLDVASLAAHAETWSGSDKASLKRASLENRRFEPSMSRVLQALGLFALGVLMTRLLGRRSADGDGA